MSSDAALPEPLVEAFQRLCQGDFSHRLPRTMKRDAADTGAFFFNSIADELERILRESRDKERRLASVVELLSTALTRVAAGDFDIEVPRDYRGDGVDVLVYLVNNMAAELRSLVAERERAAREREAELARLVDERTAQLRDSEESFRRIFEAAPVPMMLVDTHDGLVRTANETAAAVLETPLTDLVGSPAAGLFENQEDRRHLLTEWAHTVDAMTAKLVTSAGQSFWCLTNARRLSIGREAVIMVSFVDISEQKRVETMLRDLATTDALTGVLNRRRFFELAEEEIARVDRYGGDFVVALLDLDYFKSINDRFGHVVGDDALQRVARRLAEVVRKPDHVARYGGEEFAILFPRTSIENAKVVVERARVAIEEIELFDQDERVPLSVSIGASGHRQGESLESLLRRADEHLYRAKSAGRNRVEAI